MINTIISRKLSLYYCENNLHIFSVTVSYTEWCCTTIFSSKFTHTVFMSLFRTNHLYFFFLTLTPLWILKHIANNFNSSDLH